MTVQPHYDTFGEFQLSYRFGDIYTPRLDDNEPLKNECQHFVQCILKRERPRSDGAGGLAVVQEGGNPDAPGYSIQWLVDRRDVRATTFDGDWFDVGSLASLADARRRLGPG